MGYPNERLITLCTGEQVSNYSETWKAHCDARYWLRRPYSSRDQDMEAIEKRRGLDGRLALQRLMRELEPYHVLDDLPNRDVRRVYLAQVERHRGAHIRAEIEQEIIAIFERRKAETLAAPKPDAA